MIRSSTPLRLRLTVLYGSLASVVIVVLSLAVYGLHVREQYDDLDRRLVDVADPYAAGSAPVETPVGNPEHPEITVRIYEDGREIGSTPTAVGAPPVSPEATLARPHGPAYDPLVRLLPVGEDPASDASGEFGLVYSPAGVRWRTYVVQPAGADEYVVASASLDGIDEGVERFRLLLLAVATTGIGVVLAGCWLLAGLALRPFNDFNQRALDLTNSRAFERRLPTDRGDEIDDLATTFNSMLANLEAAYRLEQRFITDASHMLHAPLAAMRANLEMLEQPDMPVEARRKALSEAASEARRVNLIVDELLTLARAEAGSDLFLRPVELDHVTLDALNQASALAEGQELRIASIEPVTVLGDAEQLKQVLAALLENALENTPPGGEIAVRLRRDRERVTLSVQDTGSGIGPDDLPHVFERFYRAGSRRGPMPAGAGLGLPIAKWIVEQHGGKISIDSALGEGTTVTVELQAAP